MAPPDDEPPPNTVDGLKNKLGGWFQKAMGGDKPAAPEPPEPAFPPPPAGRPGSGPLGARPGSGPLPPTRPGSGPLGAPGAGSGPLNRPGSSSSLRLPGAGPARGSGALPGAAAGAGAPPDDPMAWTTDKPLTGLLPGEPAVPGRAPGTGDLATGAAGTGELAAPDAPPEAPPPEPTEAAPRPAAEDPAAASRRRMAFIVAYMKDPTSDRDFADKPLVYRIMSEERDHQQAQVGLLQEQLRRLAAAPPDDADAAARREELEAKLKTSQNRQAQLFLQLKKLTGVKGKTGGTGFLVAPDLPPGPPVLPPEPKRE